jgi:hypothetical protein
MVSVLAQMRNRKNAYGVLVLKSNRNRLLERPRFRRQDNINLKLKKFRLLMAHAKVHC